MLVFFSLTMLLTAVGFYLAMKWEQRRSHRHAH